MVFFFFRGWAGVAHLQSSYVALQSPFYLKLLAPALIHA
jgi:hypothetical protein